MMTSGKRTTMGTALNGVAKISSALMLVAAASVFAAEPLKVCADPDNLPFSKSEGPERGLYIELAELVAKKLDATPVQYTWWLTYFQRRALRNTAGDCDAVFALPTDADYKARGLQKTPSFLNVGYAVVAAPSFQFNSLNDLKGKRLAVQYQTTPHILFSQLEGFTYTTFRTADELFDALSKGSVDASLMWGPVAGYENKSKYASRWKVTPLTGADMNGQVSVAVRRDKPELAKDIEVALASLKVEIAALEDKYGFPRGKPVNLVVAKNDRQVVVPTSMVALIQQKPTDDAAPVKKAKPEVKTKADAKTEKKVVPAQAVEVAPVISENAKLGKVKFNDQCSHCHGSDGASPVRERDVRRLNIRYDAKWRDLALTTIKNGRPDLGMPAWKEILSEPEIQQVFSFLETIQK
jgi:ABC-type amino acid transport substrate-binding protein/mono/diheme cytochrome c family protein